MDKGKLGLHKAVSRIFTGIKVPKKDATDAGSGSVASDSAAPPKILVPPKSIVAQKSVIAPPKPVSTSKTVVPPRSSAPPETVIAPKSDVTQKPPVTPKTTTPPPRPFTIPEPTLDVTSASVPAVQTQPATKQLYEPPKATRQAIYEPPPSVPAPAASTAAAKQVKLETTVRTPTPGWQTALLKLFKPITDKLLAPKPGVSPARQMATVVVMGFLAVVFIVVLAKMIFRPAKGPKQNKKDGQNAAVAFDGSIKWEFPPLYPENARDPTVFGRATVTTEETTDKLVVKGIVYSEDNPCAVIGERICFAGDVIDGVTIVKINQNSVEFSKDNEKWIQRVER
jgi:hypothetical protein